MFKFTWSQLSDALSKKVSVVIILLPCFLIFNLFWMSRKSSYVDFNDNKTNQSYIIEDELVDGYLVWNPKCHMLDKNPMDPSIKKFVKKQKYESCSKGQLLSSVERELNGTLALVINQNVSKIYENLFCCWTPISRSVPKIPPSGNWDSKIDIGHCRDFEDRIILPPDLEVVMITCKQKSKSKEEKPKEIYKNIHPIFNPAKVQKRIEISEKEKLNPASQRKMSVLILGVDSVSRLNLERSLSKTANYLEETGWQNLKGYNKMGDNTFPNFMAIFTGQNNEAAYKNCNPQQAYGLDKCPFLWQDFRNAGYVTAYGEDVVSLSTFNYLKVGFVDPPTDYYLRPYMIACDKLLKVKKRFNMNYCTGPELTADRIFNSAVDFAKTFSDSPFFGFFWTNTISHDDSNGPSSMDDHFLKMFQNFDKEGITNDTMMIFLSDHGTRFGEIRETFVGWYEERLPFIYVRFPNWMKERNEISQAFRINEHRLTSPYDLYETLRDILIKSGGNANPSTGCSSCQSLMKPVPFIRGCEDAGISPHWCTCGTFETSSIDDKIAQEGAQYFLQHIDNAVKDYKNEKGHRLCAKFKLKRILRVDKIINPRNGTVDNVPVEGFFYLLEVTPGSAKFEVTIRIHNNGTYIISDDEISRINSYAMNSNCLKKGPKMFCHCEK